MRKSLSVPTLFSLLVLAGTAVASPDMPDMPLSDMPLPEKVPVAGGDAYRLMFGDRLSLND
ncbi:MAG TPA: hypothetical protein VKU85_13520, partial [bacterium]|nr:hypothetical protein [bacterium]